MAETTEKSNAEHLAAYDADMARHRATLPAEELTDFDIEAAVGRAELEEELLAIDDEDDGTDEDDDEEPAAFSTPPVVFGTAELVAPGAGGGDLVERRGLIFRAGSYADRDFSMTPDELRALARTFKKAPIRIEHRPTVLDGKLGHLTAVEVSPDGTELWGTTLLPGWLDRALGAGKRKVSAAFNRVSKAIVELSLVEIPRIVGAEIAAFTASRTTLPDPARDVVRRETPEAKQAWIDRRLANTATGRAVLAGRRASAPAADRPLSPYARERLKNTDLGRAILARRDNPAVFSSAVATPPTTPTTEVQIVYQSAAPPELPPIEVPDEAEGAFLEAMWKAQGEAGLALLDREIATLTNRVACYAGEYKDRGRVGGAGEVRPLVAERARLRAMREAMGRAKAGKAPAFRSPDPGAVAEAQAEAIVRGVLAAGDALRLRSATTRLPEVKARVETLRARLAGVALSEGVKLADVRERHHKDRLELAALEAERPALERAVAGGLEKALAARVAPIVAAAGGHESLARDLAETRLVDPENKPPADPESASKLVGIESKLADLGASPTSAGGGRIVLDLQARHASLVAAAEGQRREHREEIVAKAEKVVAELVGGCAWGLHSLVKAAEKQPKAFHAGLADRLKSALPEAVAEVGFLAYAHGL